MAEDYISRLLNERGRRPRAGDDDRVFEQFNTSLAVGIGHGLSSFYLDLFRTIEELTLDFEASATTEVHKGSIYFNAAVCCLYHKDFDSALYYFSEAAKENVATYGHQDADLFLRNELFENNVLKRVRLMLGEEAAAAPALSTGLFPAAYSPEDFDTVLRLLAPPTMPGSQVQAVGLLSSVIVVLCRYLVNRAFRRTNYGTSTLNYRLVVDLCVAYEAALKEFVRSKGGAPQHTLGKLLRNDLVATSLGDISTYADANLYGVAAPWPCGSLAAYDSMLLTAKVLDDIDAETDKLKQAAKLIYFVVCTRNQVAHDFDSNAAIFKDTALCHQVARRILIALWLLAYL